MTGNGRKMFDGLDKEFGYTEMAEYTKFIKETQTLVQRFRNKIKICTALTRPMNFLKTMRCCSVITV